MRFYESVRANGATQWVGVLILASLSACGSAAEPVAAETSVDGTYRGSYTLTRISDLPPSEGDVTQRTTWEIRVTAVGSYGVFNVLADPGCSIRAEGAGVNSASAVVLPNNLCRSTVLLPGAALTSTSGRLVRENNQLTVHLEFRYETGDGADRGRLVWGYTGTRQ